MLESVFENELSFGLLGVVGCMQAFRQIVSDDEVR